MKKKIMAVQPAPIEVVLFTLKYEKDQIFIRGHKKLEQNILIKPYTRPFPRLKKLFAVRFV